MASKNPVKSTDLDAEELRHARNSRVLQLWNDSDLDDLDNLLQRKLPSLTRVDARTIVLAIFRAEIGYKENRTITIWEGNKAAKPLFDFLKKRFNVSRKTFCAVFVQRNGKPFNANVLSQQGKSKN